jgi:hypothetical protein
MTPPIIIDIEASGFGCGSYPIEIGYVLASGEAWCSLIKPELDWLHWDASAQQVHHISRELLFEHGKNTKLIAQILNDSLLNQTVYSDSWAHDYVWMARLFDAAESSPHFRFEDIRLILNYQQQAHWHATKNQVVEELGEQRHRASVDAKVLQMTWTRTLALT